MSETISLINGLGGAAGFGENVLARGDDNSSALIDLSSVFGSGLDFIGGLRTSLYVNNNGVLSFLAPISTSLGNNFSGLTQPVIAPFWADVDTTVAPSGGTTPGGTSTGSSRVYWDLDTVNRAFTVTWDDVGRYNSDNSVRNAFQVRLMAPVFADETADANDFDIEFRWEAINWATRTTNVGTPTIGLDGGGDTASVLLTPSGNVALSLDIEGISNVGFAGRWLFNIRDGVVRQLTGGNDTFSGTNQEESLFGGLGDDTLLGAGGNDTLDGGPGNDYLRGGGGNDTYIVDQSGEVAQENANDGFDTVEASVSFLIGANIEALTLTGAGNTNGTGNTGNNNLAGNTGNNTLNGLQGNDNLEGGGGNDSLIGGAGDDTLDGGTGNDTMEGGADSDAYYVDSAGDVVTENGLEGYDEVFSLISYTLGAGLTGLTLLGSANLNATGNADANNIYGNAGNNVIDGGASNDQMSGGAGNDTYIVDQFDDNVSEDPDSGTDIVLASVTFALSANIEALTLQGVGDFKAFGNDLANLLTGNAGNNFLNGGLLGDTMRGGAGNDTYRVEQADDLVEEAANEGNDWVEATINYTLTANVEQLRLLGAATTGTGNAGNNSLTGNALNNTLEGQGGNDTLNGGAGADMLSGGEGIDMASYRDAATGVQARLDIASLNNGEAAGDSYAGIEGLIGTAFLDFLVGDGLDNPIMGGDGSDYIAGLDGQDRLLGEGGDDTLDGGNGFDRLEGGLGADSLIGGEGQDVASYENSAGGVTARLDIAALNTGEAAGDSYLGVEGLVGSAFFDFLVGDEAANNLLGGGSGDYLAALGGSDLLQGIDGDDTLDGGQGNDFFYGGLGADSLIGGEGFDEAGYAASAAGLTARLDFAALNTGEAAGDVYLGIEALSGTAFADFLVGDGGANQLVGDAGSDYLAGVEGEDTLRGDAGDDTLDGGTGNDVLEGGQGADSLVGGGGLDTASYAFAQAGVTARLDFAALNTGDAAGDSYQGIAILLGSNFADTLVGDAGAQTLEGGAGFDVLVGGQGADVLRGGADTDFFSFGPQDFQPGVYDVIADMNAQGANDWFATFGVDPATIVTLDFQGGVLVTLAAIGFGAGSGGVYIQNFSTAQFGGQFLAF